MTESEYQTLQNLKQSNLKLQDKLLRIQHWIHLYDDDYFKGGEIVNNVRKILDE